MGIENKTIETIDTENFDNMLQSLSSKIEDNIEKKEILSKFMLLESQISIDLDLWIWKNWEYYIVLWKNHEKYLNIWLEKEKLFNIMLELPNLIDIKNSVILSWNKYWRNIEYWEKLLTIKWLNIPMIFYKNSNIKYNFSQWKNWNYKESDNYIIPFNSKQKKENFLIHQNNKIEEIFVFIKFLRWEQIEKNDINDWICKWSVNDECIKNLWFQSNYFEK